MVSLPPSYGPCDKQCSQMGFFIESHSSCTFSSLTDSAQMQMKSVNNNGELIPVSDKMFACYSFILISSVLIVLCYVGCLCASG